MATCGHVIIDGVQYDGQYRYGANENKGSYNECLVLFDCYRVFGDDKFKVDEVLENTSEYLSLKMSYGVIPEDKRWDFMVDKTQYKTIKFFKK